MKSYLLKPQVPGGTYLALFAVVLGSVLAGVSFTGGRSIFLRVLGFTLASFGLALLLVTVWAIRRARVQVTFDAEGYTVEGPQGEYSGAWIDVTDVAVSRKTAKIALWHGPDRRTIIAHPARKMDEAFTAVREGIRAHLEDLLVDA